MNLGPLIGVPIYLVYGAIGILFFGFVFLLVLFIKTPTWPWLKAIILRRPLLAIVDRNRNINFETPKNESGGANVKKYGYFEFNPPGVYGWPGGLRGGVALSDKVPMLPPGMMYATKQLTDAGFENYSEAEVAERIARIQEEGGGEITMERLSNDFEIKDPKFLNYASDVLKKGLHKKMMASQSNGGYLVPFHYIRNFFKYNATPSGMQKTINYEKANVMDKQINRSFGFKEGMFVFLVLIGLAFAYLLYKMGAAQEAGQAVGEAAGGIKGVAGGIGT